MLTSDQLPGGKKMPWTGTHTDFVSMILSIAPEDTAADEMGEQMLRHVDFDISPYPNFRTMRLALQQKADPQGFLQVGREALQQDLQTLELLNGTGVSLPNEADADPESTLSALPEILNRMGLSPKTMQPLQPTNPFVILPDSPGEKIIWKASPADFVTLVLLTLTKGIMHEQGKNPSPRLIAERYQRFLNIDLTPYPDFRALFSACEADIDLDAVIIKGYALSEEFERCFSQQNTYKTQPFSPLIVQAIFNCKVAKEFAKRLQTDDWEEFSHLFDLLFIPDSLIGKPGW